VSSARVQIPARVRAAARRRRRTVLGSLPAPVVSRARFLKWALLGSPPGVKVSRPAPKRRPTAKKAKPKAPALPALGIGPTDVPRGRTLLEIRREILAPPGDPLQASILEIGPGFSPIFPRRDGFRTKNVDHADKAGLVRKYEPHGYSADDFEDVDYVLLAGGKMAEEVGEQFDLVIASHVLEHSTSLVHFVNEAAALIRPGGRLAFVVPDRRFCFDRFRERSSLSAVIDAAVEPRERHSLGTVTEHVLNAVSRGGSISWTPAHPGPFRHVHGLDHARSVVPAQVAGGEYVDAHHWVFTPHHLRLLFADLADLGYISLRESAFHETVGCEFYLVLTADGSGPGESRPELILKADAERTVGGPPPVFNGA
jgi:SAM-dependent methyltransferase